MKKSVEQKPNIFTSHSKIAGIFDPTHVLDTDEKELLLFESADILTKRGEKSLLFFDLALRIESREHKVMVTALLDEARPLVEQIANAFKKNVVSYSQDELKIQITPLFYHLDLLEKMRSQSALDVLRFVIAALRPHEKSIKKNLMIAGTFSYDFLDHFEKLPAPIRDVFDIPDYLFFVPLSLLIIDHKSKKTTIVAHAFDNGKGSKERAARRLKEKISMAEEKISDKEKTPKKIFGKSATIPEFVADIPDDEFCHLVTQCKEHIKQGDVYQIVPSRVFSRPIDNPILSYQALRHLNPSPYMFYVRTLHFTLFGASPETFIKVDRNGKRIAIRPIAGTRRRGFNGDGAIDEELDSREQASLCLDEKELAEHMMLVDLARNDIASVAKPKSRKIKRLLGVDRYSHVMHLVSEVEGILLKGFDALSAYQASMNMGTLMGAPKVRAAELLRELEFSKRGFYGGAVGYVDALGNLDTAIIIRSALVKNNRAYIRAGCGVVFDSLPQFEMQETKNKAEAVLRAIALAEAGSERL